MTERPVQFGRDNALTGILTEPASGAAADRPAVILLNAGLIHRVGPNRLHVRLARRLAADGIASLRLDLSGRGDSEQRPDSLSFIESGAIEVREAMDHLGRVYGLNRFVLMGICSGADLSGQVACLDTRVVGVVVIDGAAYPTPRSVRRYYLRRLFRLGTWSNTLRGRNAAGRWLRRRSAQPVAARQDGEKLVVVHAPAGPMNRAVAAALQMLVDRGVEIMTVYTGSTTTYNYAGQVRDAFADVRFGARLRERYYPAADHTFTRIAQQTALIEDVCGWMRRPFVVEAGLAGTEDRAQWGGSEPLTEVVHL